MTMSRMKSSSKACSSRSGSAMLSKTLSALYRAPCWNSTPQRLRIFLNRPASQVCSGTPKTWMLPRCGRSRPSICRSSVVLPLPDPPTRDMTSPGMTEKSRSRWTTRSPYIVQRPLTSTTGSPPISAPAHIGEDDRENRVGDDDRGDRSHHRTRRPCGEAFGIGLDAQAEVAGDQGDERAEDQALADAEPQIDLGNRGRQRGEELEEAHAELGFRRYGAPDQRDTRRPQHQQRQRHRYGRHLGKDQAQGVRYAHHRKRIQLLGHPHDPELGGDRRARASGDQDRADDRAQLAYDANAENIDDENVRADQPQLLGRKIAEHHPDEEPDQRGDPQCLRADLVDPRGKFAPRPQRRLPRHGRCIDEQLPE